MPVRADPLVFFLMSAAREIATAAVSAKVERDEATAKTLPPATTYPGTAVEPETLRRVIDESFVYLTQAQRREIFDKFNEALLDPKMTGSRAALIEYFLDRALSIRAAQMRLAQLSYEDKARLAAQFSQESAALPEEERAKLQALLQKRLLPVPADLNQMLIAGLEERR